MHRFFVSPSAIDGSRAVLRDEVARQIHTVLRMRPGDRIVLLDNAGREFEVELAEVRREQVQADICAARAASGEPRARLTLYPCLLKKDNFEWVLQKCTELGVARFVPVASRRTVVPLSNVSDAKRVRWQRIVTEAAEQSGRGRLPVLEAPHTFGEALEDAALHDVTLLPWEGATSGGVRGALSDACEGNPVPQVAVFIGPEGGFDAEEVEQAQAAGVRVVTLGPRVLRAETAAMAAALLVLHELGDMSL